MTGRSWALYSGLVLVVLGSIFTLSTNFIPPPNQPLVCVPPAEPASHLTLADPDLGKSPNDERDYHSFIMDNGLQVLLVSAPDSGRAAAALDVARGGMSNPPEWLGLTHYLEHMLFLGTARYPVPRDFRDFIESSGGNFNANVNYRNTNYFFDVPTEHFAAALDRFADLFTAPLFSLDFAEQERDIIDSEFHVGLNDLTYRYLAVIQELLNPQHPMSKFAVGNRDTLAGDAAELNAALSEFFELNYRAPLMKLVLYSDEDLGSLKAKANCYFAGLNAAPPAELILKEPLILPEHLPSLVQIEPLSEVRFLRFYFPIAGQEANYDTKPAEFVSLLLNSQVEGSLADYLISQGWSNGLEVSTDLWTPQEEAFTIGIQLTPAGNERVKEISSLVFAAIAQVRERSQEQWRYEEQAQRSRNEFNFRQQARAIVEVSQLSRQMQLLPPERWLSSSIWERYDQSKIDEVLAALSPENLLLVWLSPEAVTRQEETYYQVPYSRQLLNATELSEYSAPTAVEFNFPTANPFIAGDLNLFELETELSQPVRLANPQINGWYMFNDSFSSPRAELQLVLEPVGFDYDLKTAAYNLLVSFLMQDKLYQHGHHGFLAGYDATIDALDGNLALSISGNNDRFANWTTYVLDLVTEDSFEPDDFERVLAEVRLTLRNQAYVGATDLVWRVFAEFTDLGTWQPADLLAALETVTLSEIEAWSSQLFQELRLAAFVYGNILPTAAEDLIATIIAALPSTELQPLPNILKPEYEVSLLGEARFIVQIPNQAGDSAALLYHQAAASGHAEQAKAMLLAELLGAEFFYQLRTEQGVGYIAYTDYTLGVQRPGVFFVVQSNWLHSKDILQRITEFIATAPDYLRQLRDTEFLSYKVGLLDSLSLQPSNLAAELNRYSEDLVAGNYDFDSNSRIIKAMNDLSKQDMTDYAAALLQSPGSIAILTDERITEWEHEPSGILVSDPSSFKQRLTGSP